MSSPDAKPLAAISHDDRAGDVGREVGGKEDRWPNDVLGLSSAAERRVVHEDPHELGVVGAHFLVESRLDQAGADGVDPHPVFAEFRRKRASFSTSIIDRALRSLFVFDGPIHGIDHGLYLQELLMACSVLPRS
jgi:hypothetical protein